MTANWTSAYPFGVDWWGRAPRDVFGRQDICLPGPQRGPVEFRTHTLGMNLFTSLNGQRSSQLKNCLEFVASCETVEVAKDPAEFDGNV